MGNSKASSFAPLALQGASAPSEVPEHASDVQPRGFHFAVTWVTLFAHLDLVESTGPWRRQETNAEAPPALAIVPVVSGPLAMTPSGYQESRAAWEMVVPKMVRTGSGDFAPAEHSEGRS